MNPTTTSTPTTAIELTSPTDAQAVTVKVAADVGNSRSLTLVQEGDRVIPIVMPSARSLEVVFSAQVFGRRGLPPASWSHLGPDDHVVEITQGVEQFVGRLAVDYAASVSSGRGSDQRYSDGTTLPFILASLGAAFPKATTFNVDLATMLPIQLWALHATAAATSLKRSIKFRYNGRDLTAKIGSVQVLREGEAGYYGLPNPPKGPTFIIDGGGRTVNVAMFDRGQYVDGDTIDNMGVEVAIDAVNTRLISDGIRPLTFAERIELLDSVREGLPFHIVARNTRQRVDTIARTYFDATAATLGQELHRLGDMGSAESIVFIGGAAYPKFFGEALQESIPAIELATDPETRNVAGALVKLGGTAKKVAKRSR